MQTPEHTNLYFLEIGHAFPEDSGWEWQYKDVKGSFPAKVDSLIRHLKGRGKLGDSCSFDNVMDAIMASTAEGLKYGAKTVP